jgi:uncharacterized protein YndB with AHSA1/START domain
MSTAPVFTITRTLAASKQSVFDAFSNADALAQWWGPVEAPIDVVSLDFRPGGIFHYRMKGPQVSYGIFRYIAIHEPDSIEWVNSFANEKAEIIKAPFAGIDFPKEMLVTIHLSETDGITTLLLTSKPLHATENETSTFVAMTSSMEQGFGGTFRQLENYLRNKS